MGAGLLDHFVEAAHEVLLREVGGPIARGPLRQDRSALTADEVTVLISLAGSVRGVVLYGLSVETSLALVSHMMAEIHRQFDSLAQSGVAEMANVITGGATARLAGAGLETMISPPTLVQGKGVTISTFDLPRIVAPLACPLGELTIHLAVRQELPVCLP